MLNNEHKTGLICPLCGHDDFIQDDDGITDCKHCGFDGTNEEEVLAELRHESNEDLEVEDALDRQAGL